MRRKKKNVTGREQVAEHVWIVKVFTPLEILSAFLSDNLEFE